MSDLFLNWRFGIRHLQIGKWFVRFSVNPYFIKHDYNKWFERYQ